jgi:hypothetical protein
MLANLKKLRKFSGKQHDEQTVTAAVANEQNIASQQGWHKAMHKCHNKA